MGRGIVRRKIFLSDINRHDFMDRLASLAQGDALKIYTWVLMSYFHLLGVRDLGYSGADIARYLSVTNSCVTRIISSERKQDIDDINLEL